MPSKVLMRGFASNACCAGPERRFTGTALSARSSIKSLTMKSLFEKLSNVKLGPLGKMDLPLPPPPLLRCAIDNSVDPGNTLYYIEVFDAP
jgi:hypothetical protein